MQELAAAAGLPNPTYSLELLKQSDEMVWHAVCKIKGIKGVPNGFGFKQKDAKKDAAKQMIQLVRMYIDGLERQRAAQDDVFAKINSLVQAGEIDRPEYEYEESYDENGNPWWGCGASFYELGYTYFGYGSSKKEAQKNALEKALKDLK